jgi:hypothetical protein
MFISASGAALLNLEPCVSTLLEFLLEMFHLLPLHDAIFLVYANIPRHKA